MAVLYFTTNADSGSGSLRATITAASAGDEIRPDPSVFALGATITISLASQIDFVKDLTVSGAGRRIVLDGNESVRGVVINGGNVTLCDISIYRTKWTGVGSAIDAASGSATIKRAKIYGCESAGYGVACIVRANASATFEDCAIFNNRSTGSGSGVVDVFSPGTASLSGCTVYKNFRPSGTQSTSGTKTNCLIDVDAGFVAPASASYDYATWSATGGDDWDLRLLDDGSASPSSYRDSGTLTGLTTYDLDGNFRGRVSSGAASCSPGAYETLQADLFWVGKNSSGQDVSSPSFSSADGWAASRFATVGGTVVPTSTSKLFVDGDLTIIGTLGGTTAAAPCGLIVGGWSTVATPDLAAVYANATFGVGATVGGATESTQLYATTAKVGDFTLVNKIICFAGTSEIGTGVYCRDSRNTVGGSFPTAPAYGSIIAYRKTADAVILSGTYDVGTFTAQRNAISSSAKISTAAGTTLNVGTWFTAGWASESALGEWFTNPVRVVLAAGAMAKDASNPSGATSLLADNFTVELTGNATLILHGQKVSGSGGTVSLNGLASVEKKTTNATADLTATKLTFADNATLALVDGARVVATTLEVAGDATVSGEGTVSSETVTLHNGDNLVFQDSAIFSGGVVYVETGGTVEFANPTAFATLEAESGVQVEITGPDYLILDAIDSDRSEVELDGTDPFLSFTQAPTVDSGEITGEGYFAVPPGSDLSQIDISGEVTTCDYGARITSATISRDESTAVSTVSWTKENSTPNVCVESYVGGEWSAANAYHSGTSQAFQTTTTAFQGRIFDGEKFWNVGFLRSITLSTESPQVGTAITATIDPSDAVPTFQWYRVIND